MSNLSTNITKSLSKHYTKQLMGCCICMLYNKLWRKVIVDASRTITVLITPGSYMKLLQYTSFEE
uniref:Uncharacterized protein n=1 Tax=Arion vulgaris TaxID=1028688 RepID=A0A0B7A7N6_9EUPU